MKHYFNFLTSLTLFSLLLISACGDDNPVEDVLETTLSISAASETTGESGMAQLTVRIGTSLPVNVPVPISYSGTATENIDYTGTRSVTIPSGSTSANFAISISEDEDIEEDETVIVGIGTGNLPAGVSLGDITSVTITITDDDEEGITNEGIGDDECPNDNSTNQDNWDCDLTPTVANVYSESASGDTRTITTNGVPSHDYRNQLQNMNITGLTSTTETYNIDATPSLASSSTSILDATNHPLFEFGVAVNGVSIDPAPAEPFIFENTSTGEFNWDWVFEPNNNMEAVGLDCNVAHLQPNNSSNTGTIHYHGLIVDLPNEISPGVGSGTSTTTSPVHIGWAADGFPILYRFGPDASGNFKELAPSYQLRDGNRPGDGVSEPCGSYTGKYTNDYEFMMGSGDLDECNGISQSLTLDGETFDYFYVMTVDFPVISRCFSGTPSDDFLKRP